MPSAAPGLKAPMPRPPKDTPSPARPKPALRRRTATAPSAAAAPAKSGDRIAKVLARAGVASRRDAERIIAEGRVAVNGKVIDSPALDVGPKDRITIDGTPLPAAEPPRVWLYHKPEGLVTTTRDEQGRATIYDHLPEDLPRVMTIGRLDLNSEGLLLLTNDGELKRRLELPSTGWLRRYRVRLNGRPEDTAFDPLRKGITVEGEAFQPMTVTLDRQQGANAWLTVGLREGRNREVRRAMEAVGFTVNRLIRISYGPFQLGELKPGEVAEVRPRMLKDQLGLTETPMAEPKDAAAGPRRRAAAGEGGRPGPTTGAGRTAPATRGKPGGALADRPARGAAGGPARRRTDEDAGPAKAPRRAAAPAGGDKPAPRGTAKPAGGARGLAASAGRWLDKAERAGSAAATPAKPAGKGGLGRGGARPEAAAPRPAGTGPRSPKPGTRPDGPATGGGGKRPPRKP